MQWYCEELDYGLDLNPLAEVISRDYGNWSFSERTQEEKDAKAKEFFNSLSVEPGTKYLKLVHSTGVQKSVWGFIVAAHNDKKFPKGTILKANSYTSPARNFSRGNIYRPETFTNMRWTGAQ